MKIKKVLLLFLLIFTSCRVFPQEIFQKSYSVNNGISGNSICSAEGNGYIISTRNIDGPDVFGLLRVNDSGDTIWTRQFYTELIPSIGFPYVNVLTDGGYLVLNTAIIDSTIGILAIKTDSFGDTLWSNGYYRTANGGLSSLQVEDGSIYIASNSISEPYILKINSNGELIWLKKYYGLGGGNLHLTDTKTQIIKAGDNNLVIVATTRSGEMLETNAFIFEIDPNGMIIWGKIVGGDNIDSFRGIIQTNDHGFLAAGYSESFGGGSEDIFLVKTDSAGNIQWSRTYTGNHDESCYAIREFPDGNILLIGNHGHFDNIHGLIIKLNPSGNVVWSYVSEEVCFYKDAVVTDDYSIAITGVVPDSLNIYNKALLIVADSTGNICGTAPYPLQVDLVDPVISTYFAFDNIDGETMEIPMTLGHLDCQAATICTTTYVNENINEHDAVVIIYPDPFNSSATLTFNNSRSESFDLYVFDNLGRTVKTMLNIDSGSVKIYKEDLGSGLFIYMVQAENGILYKGKFIIL